MDSRTLIDSQLGYYRARAAEYDTTFVPYMDPGLPAAMARLRSGNLHGEVLELASGTGYWTRHLAEVADTVTCLDGSPEMIEEARRHGLANAEFHQQDLFDWTPERQWDGVFFAHWLAHVPDENFDAFWGAVRQAVRPDGVVEFVDVTGEARDLEQLDAEAPEVAVQRSLEDGRTFRIVKVFREPAELERRLSALGWTCEVEEIHPGFLYATCRP
ncbi:class I SAM-dependent methyltransferase [Streptomyces alboniger]|uniref:Class I SAM-dependent methyltransferase n=1 Tax=Streptomyces alboniger TaxID=132473 RepID=A0A5J6HHF0_STRAD|nr:class I SAM-dependent methyltransferase [Streptomyces alboniger]QEV16627.1 class I SAM-dependent methyltransferase [Streptomyces alboniger]